MGKRCQYCNKELDEVLMKCCPDCLLEKVRERERKTIRSKKMAKKLTVSREEISSAVHEGRNWDDGTFHEGDAQKALVELLKSNGVEVVG